MWSLSRYRHSYKKEFVMNMDTAQAGAWIKLGSCEDVDRLNMLVDSLQTALKNRCDLDDENVHLQQIIEKMKMESVAKEKDHAVKISNMQKAKENMQELNEANMIELRVSMEEKAIEEQRKMQNIIGDRELKIKQMEKQLCDLAKESQVELMKARMEHDAQLIKLQKQNAKVQQTTSQMSTANQDIFRKKLQHIKAEAEREVTSLKRKVSELQAKLDAQTPGQRSTSTAPLSKKKRY